MTGQRAGTGRASMVLWMRRGFDRGARVEPGRVTLRRGREEEVVPAHEISAIRVDETPGAFARTVHVVIDRGRFDPFEIPAAKAPKTPQGREQLQARVDEAWGVLRGAGTGASPVEGGDQTSAGDPS